MKYIPTFESFLNEATENMITVSLTSTAAQSFKKDLDGNKIQYDQVKPTVFEVDDTPKSRMAIKMAKERFGMQSVLVKESFLSEGKIDTFTIMIGKHKSGHNVMNVHYWDEKRHLQDYLDSADKKDKHYEVSRSELDSKIAELKKEFNIKDKDIFHNY